MVTMSCKKCGDAINLTGNYDCDRNLLDKNNWGYYISPSPKGTIICNAVCDECIDSECKQQHHDNFDPVTKPLHYNSHPSGVECITITKHHNFCIGNAIKYLWRQGLKGGQDSALQDLKKAIEYIEVEIKRLENE